MNIERSILVSFLGNYLTNTVIAGLVALVPVGAAASLVTPQYIVYVILAVIVVAVLASWVGVKDLQGGVVFGVIGFLVALVTAFVSGVAGVLTQTGSAAQMLQVIPNFWPFLASWSTLVLLLYWVVPSALVGWWKGRSAPTAPAPAQVM